MRERLLEPHRSAGGIRGSMELESVGLFPVNAPEQLCRVWTGKIRPSVWATVVERSERKSLRALAAEYGVSHETARRTLRQVGTQAGSTCTIGTESEVGKREAGPLSVTFQDSLKHYKAPLE